jgi:hypothetical protein
LNAKRGKVEKVEIVEKVKNVDLFITIKSEEGSKDDLLSMLTASASLPSTLPDPFPFIRYVY